MPHLPTMVRTTNYSLGFISSVWWWIFQTSSALFRAAQSSSCKIPQTEIDIVRSLKFSFHLSLQWFFVSKQWVGPQVCFVHAKNEPHNPSIWADQYCSMSHRGMASRVRTLPTSPAASGRQPHSLPTARFWQGWKEILRCPVRMWAVPDVKEWSVNLSLHFLNEEPH